jgi:hypothetical protein
MPAASGWRSPRAAEQYEDHDLADFAQEFLSRNQDYRREYKEAQLRAAARHAPRQTEMEGLARRWGLSFPLRSRHRLSKLARAVVA